MSGLMQPGPTLRAADEARRKRGSQGLLAAVGEPMSYAPGIGGLLGNALLSAQYLTGEKSAEEGASALAMLTGLLQGTKVAPIMRNAIKVYHGSPHKFDKADSSNIGTGEGAQAYGHGLYWAEDKGVAESYRNAMNDWYPNAAKTKPGTVEDAAAAHVASAIDGQYQNPYAQAKDWIRRQGGPRADDKIAAIEKWQKEGVEFKRGGSLYEASLRWPDASREAADPLSAKHFLDWDKPLSEQAQGIKDAVSKIRGGWVTGTSGERRFLDPARSQRTGAGLLDDLKMLRQGRPEDLLRQAGIPGITYLDAGSRAAGAGTRNYVTFDDALVELLKRNGVSLVK
jgi:hypothetical protein